VIVIAETWAYLVLHVVSNDNADKQRETDHTSNEDKEMYEDTMCLSTQTSSSSSSLSLKRGDYQNCSVLYCVLKLCTVISTPR